MTARTVLFWKDLSSEVYEPEYLCSFPIQKTTFIIHSIYKIIIPQAWISLPQGATLPQMLIVNDKT